MAARVSTNMVRRAPTSVSRSAWVDPGSRSSGMPSTSVDSVVWAARSCARRMATGTYPRASSKLSSAARRWATIPQPRVTAKATTVTAKEASTRRAMGDRGFSSWSRRDGGKPGGKPSGRHRGIVPCSTTS